MSENPVVSVIIPTFNRQDVICDAIESVLGQTYRNIELIVVDDGSVDDTVAKLNRFKHHIKVIKQTNGGPGAARNRGLASATGSLVAFLDSDDLWLPRKLERQVEALTRAGNGVCCCLCNVAMKWRDRESTSFQVAGLVPGQECGVWTNASVVLASRFVLFNQAVLIRREILDRIGPFEANLRVLEDYELALRLSLVGPWCVIEEPLVVWRETADSCTAVAYRDEIRLRRPMVEILEQHLERIRRSGRKTEQDKETVKVVRTELESAKRFLRAAEWRRDGGASLALAAKVLHLGEHYRKALFRRTPLFPQMAVAPLTDYPVGVADNGLSPIVR